MATEREPCALLDWDTEFWGVRIGRVLGVGYMTVHADRAAGQGSLGLSSVAPEARRQGVGQALVRGAVAWCHEHGLGEVTVVTQGRNVPALRVFESCGFRIRDVRLWFHKWYER